MSASNKSGLSGKGIGLYIENQVTADLFKSNRHLTVIPDIESHLYVSHFFLNCLLPKVSPRLPIEPKCFFDRLGEQDTVLVRPCLVTGLHLPNDSISFP